MTNVLDLSSRLEKGLETRLKKHLDLAEIWLETGDRIAYDDHMKIAESILEQLETLVNHK